MHSGTGVDSAVDEEHSHVIAVEPLDGMQQSGFFALRSPLLAFDELRAWSEGLSAPHLVGDAAALRADRAQLTERLLAIWRRPEVREAVFLASPELDAGRSVDRSA